VKVKFSLRRKQAMAVEVGDMAPDFELPSHLEKGKKVRLSDFRGKKNVFIAFYPLAWTPV
jgi:peroxiredoxin